MRSSRGARPQPSGGRLPGWFGLPSGYARRSRRRRWIAAAVAAVGLATLGLWFLMRTLPPAVDATWERILETGVLRVCTDPSWPPFESVDPAGGARGLDIDLAQALAPRLAPNVRLEIVTVGFDGLYDALLAGRCDAILSALPYEPERTQDIAYSVAYFNAGLVTVVREGAADVRSLADLWGQVVGVEWGFVPEGDSRQRLTLRGLSLRRYETTGDALRAVHSGEVDAALVDRISALAYVRLCEGVTIAGEPIADLNYVIPVRPDSFRLLAEIDRVLLEMREDGTLERLQARWF